MDSTADNKAAGRSSTKYAAPLSSQLVRLCRLTLNQKNRNKQNRSDGRGDRPGVLLGWMVGRVGWSNGS